MLQAEEISCKSGECGKTTTQAHSQHQIYFFRKRSVAFAQANQYAQQKTTKHIDGQCTPRHTQPMDRLASQVSQVAERTAYGATKHYIKQIFKHTHEICRKDTRKFADLQIKSPIRAIFSVEAYPKSLPEGKDLRFAENHARRKVDRRAAELRFRGHAKCTPQTHEVYRGSRRDTSV